MKTSELQYDLPPELIAQQPAAQRDASRLLVVNRQTRQLEHTTFDQIMGYLPERSLLVVNDTRVVPAKIEARRRTGGKIPGLFLREIETGVWDVLLKASRLREGQELMLADGRYIATLEHRGERGEWRIRLTPPTAAETVLTAIGHMPLPPYIHREKLEEADERVDRERYQTIYAERPGAVAAPTAGLHFTQAVFASLAERGIETVRTTLHVGQGTFAPITVDDLASHNMHTEWYDLSATAADHINTARTQGRKIVSVGTTSTRVLESCADETGRVHAGQGWTNIFIYPPYRFRAVDTLITNFHLPGSTLLALVYAFGGRDLIRKAYETAIAERYRFFSYGDAMTIL